MNNPAPNEIPLPRAFKALNPDATSAIQPSPATRLKCPKCEFGADHGERIAQDDRGNNDCPRCHFQWKTSINRNDDKMQVLNNSIGEDLRKVIFKSPEVLALHGATRFVRKLGDLLDNI